MTRSITILIALLMFAVCAFAQGSDDPVKTGVSDIYLARDDGNGAAGEQATSFLTTDVPIYCVVQLDSAGPVTVKMKLVAVNVPGVKADTLVVTTSYTTEGRQDRVNFTGRPDGRWVVGKYRVDVYVEEELRGSREFTVQKTLPAKTADDAPPKPAAPKPGRRLIG